MAIARQYIANANIISREYYFSSAQQQIARSHRANKLKKLPRPEANRTILPLDRIVLRQQLPIRYILNSLLYILITGAASEGSKVVRQTELSLHRLLRRLANRRFAYDMGANALRWCDLPRGKQQASKSAAHCWLKRCKEDGTFEHLHSRILAIADSQGLINWNYGAVDGSSCSVLTRRKPPSRRCVMRSESFRAFSRRIGRR